MVQPYAFVHGSQIYSHVPNYGALETLKSRHFELLRQPQTVPNWHHCPSEDSMLLGLKRNPEQNVERMISAQS